MVISADVVVPERAAILYGFNRGYRGNRSKKKLSRTSLADGRIIYANPKETDILTLLKANNGSILIIHEGLCLPKSNLIWHSTSLNLYANLFATTGR